MASWGHVLVLKSETSGQLGSRSCVEESCLSIQREVGQLANIGERLTLK